VVNHEDWDEIVPVTGEEARDWALALGSREGIFCGISSGGTFAAAVRVAEKAPEGTVLLAMLPDTGERYLTTYMFEGISEESDELPG
jgi:cysteine synthase A